MNIRREEALHTLQIALLKIIPRTKTPRSYLVTARAASGSAFRTQTGTEFAENVTAIAAEAPDDLLAHPYLNSGARALLKFLATEKAMAKLRKNDDELVNVPGSLAVDVAAGAAKQANLSTWRMLPAKLQIDRLTLPVGDMRYPI